LVSFDELQRNKFTVQVEAAGTNECLLWQAITLARLGHTEYLIRSILFGAGADGCRLERTNFSEREQESW
jgi:hypothetical protein